MTERLSNLDIIKKYYIPDAELEEKPEMQEPKLQICIDRYSLISDTVFYYVRLRDLLKDEEWTIKARYSELRDLH
jgi:hypothetical protein